MTPHFAAIVSFAIANCPAPPMAISAGEAFAAQFSACFAGGAARAASGTIAAKWSGGRRVHEVEIKVRHLGKP
jgi:hypothetical protein